ncbi:MAG: polysaccharide deacetylase family protein, partial [Pseudohongiellaceae bacterium]
LRDNDFVILRLEEVIDRLRNNQALPDKAAVITFDDAYRNVYEQAYPLLREYDWPFTMFITSGLVNSNPGLYANWEQLREMGGNGATLANHTVSHPYFLERQAGENESRWLERIGREITDAEQQILAETGQNHRLLAYPYGEYDPRIQELVTQLGFVGIGQHSGPVNSSSDFTALPRFPFSGIYASMNTFPVKVNSLAFNLLSESPDSPVTSESSPSAVIAFQEGDYNLEQLACYNNNQPIQVTALSEPRTFRVETSVLNNSRRFRYNCTAPGPSGRFFWYSIDWVNPAIPE